MKLIEGLTAAANRGVPLVSITTPDPAATINEVVAKVRTNKPKIRWDMVRGFNALNEEGLAVGVNGEAAMKPLEAITKAMAAFPEDTILFIQMANRFLDMPPFIQAIWNCRDKFKADGRMLVLLGPDIQLPPELSRDVVAFDEPLPDDAQLKNIAEMIAQSADVEAESEVIDEVVNATRGLSAFEAEQVVAMSTHKDGIRTHDVWERKRQAVEKAKGLTVHNGQTKFDALAGLSQVKDYLTGLMQGPLSPNAVVWLDEIEKSGLAHTQDLSGVNSDQLGTVLSYMEDHKAFGIILVGVPGCGKSEICKAVPGEFGKMTIRLDMGAMQGSLVGQSQAQLRNALKTIDAVAGESPLFIATSNSIDSLDTALKSRFTDVFFFDLPTDEQIEAAWKIHLRGFGLDEHQQRPTSNGWSGRNVQRCCQKAYSTGRSITAASQFVISELKSSGSVIEDLRRKAHGKYLATEYPGAYDMHQGIQNGRKLTV